MTLAEQLADTLRRLHFGKSWVATDLKTVLADVTWEEATQQVFDLNSILALTYHMHYYFAGVLQVLQGGELTIRDKYSFDHPMIHSQADWDQLLTKVWQTAEQFAEAVEQLEEEQLKGLMTEEKYGSWFRNLLVMTEHSHYHLGQIALLKKILRAQP